MSGNLLHEVGGIPLTRIREALDGYRRLPGPERLDYYLDNAMRNGAIPARHPAYLTFSPLGIHNGVFQTLASEPSLPYRNRTTPLRIACYGAGLQDDAAYLESWNHPADVALLPSLRGLQEYLFGPARGTSYEPRELLALLLNHERSGELHVFDNDPRVQEELHRPEFTFLDIWEAFFSDPPMDPTLLARYWGQWIAQGRSVTLGAHPLTAGGPTVFSSSFRFEPAEIRKLHLHPVDLATDSIPVQEPFDLSVWLEGWYFLEAPLAMVAWAKILERTRLGGHIVTSILPQSEATQRSMGITVEGVVTSRLVRGQPHETTIYRKVEEREEISRLASNQI